MALIPSTGLRNKVLDTGSLKSVLANGFVHVYASAPADIPATADAAIDPMKHTKLLTVYGDGSATGLNLGTADGGVVGKAVGESWSGTVLVTGNAAFFRYVGSADTGALSTTQPRFQGRAGTANAEMNLGAIAMEVGTTREIKYVSIGFPA